MWRLIDIGIGIGENRPLTVYRNRFQQESASFQMGFGISIGLVLQYGIQYWYRQNSAFH